jgi:hypothetical protein
MTIEPAMPDEPPVVRAPAPRLMRRDAGFDAAEKADDDHG